MPNMDLINQEYNEKRYSRKHIDGYIREEILKHPNTIDKINKGVVLLQDYMSKTYYESKNKRIAQLQGIVLHDLVVDMLVGIAYFQQPELMTSVTAQLAGRLKMSDRVEAITTIAEMTAVLCMTDAFDVFKTSKMSSWMVRSRIPLSQKLIDHIEHSQYLPPMVCEPLELKSNYCSGYLTHTDSLILGKGNHHDEDICLDVLNIINKIPLKLDLDFLCTVEEDPKELTIDTMKENAAKKGKAINNMEARERLDKAVKNWQAFKKQSYRFYDLITSQGNRFYLTNKYDKRGRIYAQGYHINTQGASFKKAAVELADEELVEGAPV